MRSLITELFEAYGFHGAQAKGFDFFARTEDSQKREFWIVTEDPDDILSRQSQIAKECRRLTPHAELEKNSSMLVLQKVDEGSDLSVLKKMSLLIEENQYFFKKYVLLYSASELADFREQQGEDAARKFIYNTVLRQATFSAYKQDPNKFCWQSFVYKLCNKLPFLEVKVVANKGLKPLFETNDKKLEAAGLISLNNSVQMFELTHDRKELDGLPAKEVLKFLLPKPKENEDQ